MQCKKCGKFIDDSSLFCLYCGIKVGQSEECTRETTEVDPLEEFAKEIQDKAKKQSKKDRKNGVLQLGILALLISLFFFYHSLIAGIIAVFLAICIFLFTLAYWCT